MQIQRKSNNTALCERLLTTFKYSVESFKYLMTKRSELVLDFIKAYMRIHGVPPSYEVIAKGLGLKAKSNIHRIVHRLKNDGFLTVKAYKFHSVKLVDQSVKAITSL